MIEDSLIVALLLSLPAVGVILGQFIFSRRKMEQSSPHLLKDFDPEWASPSEKPPHLYLMGSSTLDLAEQIIADGERQILRLEEQLYIVSRVRRINVAPLRCTDGVVEPEIRRAA